MEEPKRYKIETIKELSELINEDNFENVMTDLVSSFGMLSKLKKDHPKTTMESFTWIDDGKNDISATINVKEDES